MSTPAAGVNLATTKNGEKYNKLKRPDDFIANIAVPPAKRTYEEVIIVSDEEQDDEPPSKRARETFTRIKRPLNMQTGMHSMFPGFLDEDHSSSDETTNEALAYLRSVRSEADSIPSLLKAAPAPLAPDAPDRSMYDDIRGDFSVIYEDGTWIAREQPRPGHRSYAASTDDSAELSPQDAYHKTLLQQFYILRKTLANLKNKKPPSQSGRAPPRGRHDWLHSLDRESPTPAQLSQMDEYDIFQGLKYCVHSLDRFQYIAKKKSRWIWALLAKAPESGTLDYTRVGCIRDLGHKAGQCSLRLRSGTSLRDKDDSDDEEREGWEGDGNVKEEDGEIREDSQDGQQGHITPPTLPPPQKDNEDSRDEQQNNISFPPAVPTLQEDNEAHSDTNMSISSEDKPQDEEEEDEHDTLEKARARLLAQLGDRLVTSDSVSNQDNSNPPPVRVYLSRAEAEFERQNLRDQTLKKPSVQSTPQSPAKAQCPPDTMIDFTNTKATLDMILTVVAELYGQRDLLRFRDVWG
ncbi:hypothetical protein B0J11DRAFT_432683 [Dendryphion nanum]|uniref:Uncharacterized protein n=1 Tax=Dendryphion nanum TaxID=256645 RepID=A0A9P9DWH2_9PLEO|nr:hypothetical protein B0J11DRAFT_432683 [Dendryphion nanum]